jgi:hypothetical protein
MSLIVEDGSIVAGANSFISLADADAYFEVRGNAAWSAADDDAKTAALIRATDYLTRHYVWKGATVKQAQALCWPRSPSSPYPYNTYFATASGYLGTSDPLLDQNGWVIANNVVPQQVKAAQCLLALEALTQALDPALERGNLIRRESVAGAVDIEYEPGAPGRTVFPAVDSLLRGLVRAGGMATFARA